MFHLACTLYFFVLVRQTQEVKFPATETFQAITSSLATSFPSPMIFDARKPTCQSPGKYSQTVYLRIEGPVSTIFEGDITSGPAKLTTASGGTHECNGLNNGANLRPGATCTTAMAQAACERRFSWDGTFDTEFDDFFVTGIGNDGESENEFWGLLLNYKFTPVGGCQQETEVHDDVLWAYDAFNAVAFLQASPSADFSTKIRTANVDKPNLIYVRDGNSGAAIQGASIGSAVTNANGVAEISFTAPGTYVSKATKPDAIRSNAVTLVVSS